MFTSNSSYSSLKYKYRIKGSVFVMSEPPASDPKRPELKDLVIALRDLVECHALGLQLDLPESTLKLIDKHHDSKDHLRMMLSEWLQFDPEASWEKLATALDKIGKNAIAANVRRREFVSIAQPPEQESKRSQAMAETVLRKIKSRFSLLVIEVQKSMASLKVDSSIVEQFLLNYFEGDCDIPEDAGLSKIFKSVTKARLWRYDHYGPLEELAESFLPEDDPARVQVTEYKSQLTGFQATTRIIDFVKLNELEDREEIPSRLFSPKRYNSHYQKLTVDLRLNKDMSELTLEYVNTFWKILAKEFHLPPLTAVMDKIVEGSLRITWLILPHIIDKIRATYFKSVEFFQQHNIISIRLYGDRGDDGGLNLYHEKWMTGSTPLFRASFAGNIDQVKTLLEGGANVNEANDNKVGLTPLIGACMTGQADVAKLLLEHKANVHYRDKLGGSALHAASQYRSTATVFVLLEYRAHVDIILSNIESTPLMLACTYDSATIVRALLEHGASVDLCNADGRSALMYASIGGRQETVAVLLEYKAQVNLVAKDDRTALAYAVTFGYANFAKFLLENGATMDFENKVWKDLLRHASEQGFSEVVSVLLEYAAPVNLIVDEEQGNNLLGVACEKGRAETVKVLLDHGATIDYQNKKGQSAVHLASVGGHTETLKVLIEKTPQLNLQDQNGWTPLHFAVNQGHLKIVELLLEHGAAVDIQSNSGLTALRMAQSEGGHQDVCDILLRHTQHDGSSIQQTERGSEGEGEMNRQQQETNAQLTEAQQAEVKSVGDRIWEQVKKAFLRERVKKEEAAGASELIMPQRKRTRRSIFDFLLGRGQRT